MEKKCINSNSRGLLMIIVLPSLLLFFLFDNTYFECWLNSNTYMGASGQSKSNQK